MVKVPIEISARHIHLCQKDLEALFGQGYKLKKFKDLTQPSDFAAEEKIDIRFGTDIIPKVRIVGPIREKTEVELSLTDAIALGIVSDLEEAKDIKNTPGLRLIGPKGEIRYNKGAIINFRHLHCSPKEAQVLGLKNGDRISIKSEGEREVIFNNVLVRVNENYRLCLHLDTDEGNATGIDKKTYGFLINSSR